VLIEIGSQPLVSALVTAAVLVTAFAVLRSWTLPSWWSRILLALIVIRFAVPIAVLGSDVVFERFLKDKHDVARAAVADVQKGVENFSPAEPQSKADEGLIDRLKAWLHLADLKKYVEGYADRLSTATKDKVSHFINLIVVFVVQTMVMPLLILWGIIKICKSCLGLGRSPLGGPDRLTRL